MKRGLNNLNPRFFRGAQKRGQQTMSMPFGIIFSVFLIAVFIVVAFMAAKAFLDFGKCASVGSFYDELESELNSIGGTDTSEKDFKIVLPGNVEMVCFANLSAQITESEIYEEIKHYAVYNANTFLLPRGASCDIPYKTLPDINLEETTKNKNPYCIDLSKRKTITLKKGFYEKAVTIQ